MIPSGNNVQRLNKTALGKHLAWGALIALILVSVFLAGVRNPAPEWPRFWMLRPLIVVPVAGALGGFFYFMTGGWRRAGGWRSIVGYMAGILLYMVVLWLGSVLGLAGTLWH